MVFFTQWCLNKLWLLFFIHKVIICFHSMKSWKNFMHQNLSNWILCLHPLWKWTVRGRKKCFKLNINLINLLLMFRSLKWKLWRLETAVDHSSSSSTTPRFVSHCPRESRGPTPCLPSLSGSHEPTSCRQINVLFYINKLLKTQSCELFANFNQ